MNFGYGGISCQRYPGSELKHSEIYQDALLLAQHAEDVGFDSVWVTEHHFSDDGWMSGVLPFSAAIGARTSRITVGTAVLLAPLHDPIRIAEDAATVDLVCGGGRFILGLGMGYVPAECAAFGVSMADRVERLTWIVEFLRHAWAGENVNPVRGNGEEIVVSPQPETAPPIWIGGLSEAAIRRAGRIADGFIASYVANPGQLRNQVEWAKQGAESVGRDSSKLDFAVSVPVFAWSDDDAWERIREQYCYVCWKYDDFLDTRDRRGGPKVPPRPSFQKVEEWRSNLIVGRPDEVAERISLLQDVVGPDLHFVARLYYPGLERSVQTAAIDTFSEDVMTKFR